MPPRRFLSGPEIRTVYDRTGRWQDAQAVYDAPAVDALLAHGAFEEADTLFEIGCGTGRVADRLLRSHAPPDARYVGVDLSATMVDLARDRMAAFGDRAEVVQTDGTFAYNFSDGSQDRVVATYVLDLLSPADRRAVLNEAHRLLASDGRLCLAGLTWGERPLGRCVAAAWAAVHAVRPEWVGGCRPVRTRDVLPGEQWRLHHCESVRAWGVPSEVLVAGPA